MSAIEFAPTLDDYTIVLFKDDDTFVATIPALPGCHTIGETREEAIRELELAFQAWAEIAEEDGKTLPRESPGLIKIAG